MGKYLFQIVLTLSFWACVIWGGLPRLKQHAPGPYAHLVSFFSNDGEMDKIVSGAVGKAERTIKSITPSAVALEADPIYQGNSNSAPVKSNEDEKVEMRLLPVLLPPVEQETDPNSREPEQTERDQLPNTTYSKEPVVEDDPLSALNKDPGYEWGIVVTNSFIYDADMKRIGIFLGGTVVSRKNSELKMNGYVAECFYLKGREWEADTVFIYESDLVRFDTTYEEADREQRNVLIKYCQTLAQLEEKRAEAYKKAIMNNPHFDAYKAAMEAYNEFFRKAAAAKAELDQSVGQQRSRLMDELRKYKAEEAAIVRRYQETKKQYDSWKKEHVENGQTSDIGKSVEMQSLENILQSLRPEVQKMVPGL